MTMVFRKLKILMIPEVRVNQLIPITDEEFGAHSRIRSASVVDPWIFLVLESGKVAVYEMNTKTKDVEVHSKMSSIEVPLRKCCLTCRANSFVDVYFKDDKQISYREKSFVEPKLCLPRLHPLNGRGRLMMTWIFTARKRQRKRNLVDLMAS